MTTPEFCSYLTNIHGPLALKLPGLRRYVQNFVVNDGKRLHPGWDAMVELYFDDRTSMEAAWETCEGQASDADLPLFLDIERTSWSIVEEAVLL